MHSEPQTSLDTTTDYDSTMDEKFWDDYESIRQNPRCFEDSVWAVYYQHRLSTYLGNELDSQFDVNQYRKRKKEILDMLHAKTSSDRHQGEFYIPDKFALNPVYPNPFNSQLILSFDIPRKVNVKFEVFDILGRKVSNIYNDAIKPGRHLLHYQMNEIASGTYFIRMETEQFTATRRILLLK